MSRTESDVSTDSSSHPWLRRLQATRFTQLLATLSLLLLTAPVANAFQSEISRAIATWLVVVSFSLVVVAAAAAVSRGNRHTRPVLVLAALCVIVTIPRAMLQSTSLEVVEGVLIVCFLTYVVCMIVGALFAERHVTYDTIAASLCGYLLIGVIFSVIYSLVIAYDSNAVSINSAGAVGNAEIHFGDHQTASALYFSFVTLTTLGYGDLTPVSITARMLTASEALIGQLYLVVLVSRLVALHIAGEMAERRSGQPKPDDHGSGPGVE